MTWCNSRGDDRARIRSPNSSSDATFFDENLLVATAKACPSCGHRFQLQGVQATTIQDLPGLPAGVKFDPTDQELLEHLEGKARPDSRKLHPLIDEFIPSLEGENGICYTHPEKLPGLQALSPATSGSGSSTIGGSGSGSGTIGGSGSGSGTIGGSDLRQRRRRPQAASVRFLPSSGGGGGGFLASFGGGGGNLNVQRQRLQQAAVTGYIQGMASRAPIPLMRCPFGHGYCVIRISQTERNPGRYYYKCKEGACEFFMWCDHLATFVESSTSCCCEKEGKIRTLECRIMELEEEIKCCQSLLKKTNMFVKAFQEGFSFLNISADEDESDGDFDISSLKI